MSSERRIATSAVSSPLKWHRRGGKGPIASKIVSLFPPRCKTPNNPSPDDPGWLHYVEPYFGGGSVMFALDPEGISEVVNDLNVDLANFWHVLQCDKHFAAFARRVQAVPFSESEFDDAKLVVPYRSLPDRASRDLLAADFFIRCRQSLAARMESFAPLSRNRTRRGMNEQVSAWLTAVEGLPAVHERLKRVVILNRDALDVIRQQDGKRTLFYLDPPYLHETRATTGEYGEHEMTATQHEELLKTLASIEGRFVLSGYRSEMYDAFADANGWRRVDLDVPNHAAGGKEKRRMVESLWLNY